MARTTTPKLPTDVKVHTHQDTRLNIPPAELEPLMSAEDRKPKTLRYPRNTDLDPQLVWRGKDDQDWSDLVVQAPPLFIQEKVHPKVLIDDLIRQTAERAKQEAPDTPDLFADFNGLPDKEAATEFYQHPSHWTNRMILGDSLAVMASLAEREGLRGKVQAIFLDPPYGIKFNSNFQWSTHSRDVQDGKADHVTREPEMVKAFRDTWKDGIHSYLTYLRDRLTVARDLLAETGSIFVQIGDENVHRIRTVLDEVFGDGNFVSQITYQKTTGATSDFLGGTLDYILWYGKDKSKTKFRPLFTEKVVGEEGATKYKKAIFPSGRRMPSAAITASIVESEGCDPDLYTDADLTSQSMGRAKGEGAASWFPVSHNGKEYRPSMQARWKTNELGFQRLLASDRIEPSKNIIRYVRKLKDFPAFGISDLWRDIGGIQSRTDPKVYVVQTSVVAVQRCILMATDPGDLVLDPTCGSGTSAFVAEQWGRRWITIDTSRVALALSRARIMGARYPYYHLRDTPEGVREEAKLRRVPPPEERLAEVSRRGRKPDIRQGFVYERIPHIMLSSIASNAEIDVIWADFQARLEPLREALNTAIGQSWQEWDIPRDVGKDWPAAARDAHSAWWDQRIKRQKEIDASIAAKADYEYLYDKPIPDPSKVRVAGPFTVESLSPHRVLAVDHDDELIDTAADRPEPQEAQDFTTMVLENLRTSGVHQMDKGDRITFSTVSPWPGTYVCAEGRYQEGEDGPLRRAGIFIGPEFGTVQRADLVACARECVEAGFDIMVACAFSYAAQCTDLNKMGPLPILRARMNPDLHMADDLKNTGTGNLFVVFGEPDIDLIEDGGDLRIRINGVNVFKPSTGQVQFDGPEGIACWFIDTDYNEESFFVRHAYFLGSGDPYKALKTTLRAEVDEEAWNTLNSDTSRPFPRPKTGRIAVKIINHLGDEVMKVYAV